MVSTMADCQRWFNWLCFNFSQHAMKREFKPYDYSVQIISEPDPKHLFQTMSGESIKPNLPRTSENYSH